MTVALLGLGLMGRPMARTLLAAGWPVIGWNRSPLDPALTAGIRSRRRWPRPRKPRRSS